MLTVTHEKRFHLLEGSIVLVLLDEVYCLLYCTRFRRSQWPHPTPWGRIRFWSWRLLKHWQRLLIHLVLLLWWPYLLIVLLSLVLSSTTFVALSLALRIASFGVLVLARTLFVSSSLVASFLIH